MSRPWQDDDDLLADLVETADRAALSDPVRRAARTAFARRAVGAGVRLAAVRYDSLLDVLQLRGDLPNGQRIVTFESDELSVEVEIVGDRLIGQLVPPEAGRVEIETLDGVAGLTTTNALGCFELSKPAPGPVRFRCHVASGVVATDWIRLF